MPFFKYFFILFYVDNFKLNSVIKKILEQLLLFRLIHDSHHVKCMSLFNHPCSQDVWLQSTAFRPPSANDVIACHVALCMLYMYMYKDNLRFTLRYIGGVLKDHIESRDPRP